MVLIFHYIHKTLAVQFWNRFNLGISVFVEILEKKIVYWIYLRNIIMCVYEAGDNVPRINN